MLKSNTKKITEIQSNIARGNIIRCKGATPDENYIDFLITEESTKLGLQYSLLKISGFKAGLRFSILPQESIPIEDKNGGAIDIIWLRKNWSKWGYFECPLEHVYIVYRDPPDSFDSY